MKKFIVWVGLSFLYLTVAAQLNNTNTSIHLGNTIIQTYSVSSMPQKKGIYFFNPHSDENTAYKVATKYIEDNGGNFLSLAHEADTRNITFLLGDKKFVFDPNRMFSTVGRKATLKAQSPKTSLQNKTLIAQAEIEVAKLATKVLEEMPKPKLIIAVHNNSNKGTLSINSYRKGKPEAKNAAKVNINMQMDADDFVFTTEENVFNFLQKKQVNVVLQSNTCIEDGSLSVYCGKNKIPYINIEVEVGHDKEQLRIIKMLEPIMSKYEKQ